MFGAPEPRGAAADCRGSRGERKNETVENMRNSTIFALTLSLQGKRQPKVGLKHRAECSRPTEQDVRFLETL